MSKVRRDLQEREGSRYKKQLSRMIMEKQREKSDHRNFNKNNSWTIHKLKPVTSRIKIKKCSYFQQFSTIIMHAPDLTFPSEISLSAPIFPSPMKMIAMI